MRSCAVLLGCLTLPALTSHAGDSGPGTMPQIVFEKYRLANGLRVILSPDDRLPLVAVNVRYDVGSANDPPGQAGLAHLFEHLFSFAPLATLGEPPIALLQQAGATQASAVTSPNRTTYFTTVPSGKLELALAIEGDRMRHFAGTVDEALFSRERTIVLNERRLNVDAKPYGTTDEAVFETLFPAGHPYRHRYIGTVAGIEGASLAQARRFFDRYYDPGNATLSIAGRIEPARVKALIERYLGPVPGRSMEVPPGSVGLPAEAAPFAAHEPRKTVRDRVTLPRVTLAWLAPPAFGPGDDEMRMLPFVLGGPAGELHRDIVHRRSLAQEMAVEHFPYAGASVFRIEATARPGMGPEDLERALVETLEARLREGFGRDEMERARRTLELQMLQGLERLGDITSADDGARATPYGGVADQLSQCDRFFGDPGCLPRMLQRYRAVTPDTMRKVARSVLGERNRVIIHTLPAMPAEAESHDSKSSGVQAAQLPVPQRFTLANGLTVLYFEQRKLPVIRANLVVRGGSATSPASQPGIASFTADMLLHGTQERSAEQMTGEATQLGTSLEMDVGSDGAALGLSTLSGNLGEGIGLLADAIQRPAFAREEVDKVREGRLARQAGVRNDPEVIACHLLMEALFPAQSPYRNAGLLNDGLFAPTPPYGCDEAQPEIALKGIAREDLVSFWRHAYRPERSALVVAGDVSLEALRGLAQLHFGNWAGAATADSGQPEPAAPVAQRSRIVMANAGAASQTVLRVGIAVDASLNGPEYAPLRMANIVLGEIHSSRLTKNLRERNGYTYVVRSRLASRRAPGQVFVIGTSVKTEATAEAVRELMAEVRRISEEPVTTGELDLAKNVLLGNLVGRFEVTSEAATAMGELFLLGLPLDYYSDLQKRIDAVGIADIQRAARAHLPAKSMAVVAVGDLSRIEVGLRALDIAGVSVR